MKIVFVCGSLEPGTDGVGDYTRRLASELIRQGNEAAIVAINDHAVSKQYEGTQLSDQVSVPVLRIPASLGFKKRLGLAKKWIDDVDPTWISLQFVVFSFHPKGLPFGLSRQLQLLGKGRNWHIMFHELWIGMDSNSTKKHVLWGRIQRQLIRSIIQKLKPKVIHTQTRLYQTQLAKLGAVAEYLPLFANIPTLFEREVKSTEESEKLVSLVVFGSIHAGAPIDEFAKEVASYTKKHDTEVRLTLVGRVGDEQNNWVKVWKSYNLSLEVLGEQPFEKISEVLSRSTLGISTTPLELAEKSGSIAAMQAHGLPVLCIRKPWKAKDVDAFEPINGIVAYESGILETVFRNRIKVASSNKVSEVAALLAQSFSESEMKVAVVE